MSENEQPKNEVPEIPLSSTIEDMELMLGTLEAVLFSAGEPLNEERLSEILSLEGELVTQLLSAYEETLSSSSRGVSLVKVRGGVVLRTKPDFAQTLAQLKAPIQRRLSSQALETLAVVAYRQPVVKSDIDTIRGVDVGPTLKTLLERELIAVIGHESSIGNPSLYGTTEYFLSVFGLDSLKDLPKIDALLSFEKKMSQEQSAAA